MEEKGIGLLGAHANLISAMCWVSCYKRPMLMKRTLWSHGLGVACLVSGVLGCSATSTDPGGAQSLPDVADGSGGSGTGGGASVPRVTLPAGTGTSMVDVGQGIGTTMSDCNPQLVGRVRDFNSSDSPVNPHPDFQTFSGMAPTLGLVNVALGPDGAPVYADPQPPGNPQLTSAVEFQKWYSTSHPANATIELNLDAPPASAGIVKTVDMATGNTTYESTSFFPIDGKGTQAEDLLYTDMTEDMSNLTDGVPHNYHFTFELNTKFKYKKGQVFTFFGDDDLWVFIDKKLALDAGGLHGRHEADVMLDTLNLVEGMEYDLSVFHAERRTDQSNFKVTTNITFTNCNPILR